MTDLFSPLTLRETTIPNRVMVSPMCQYSCDAGDGLATEWHRVHLGSRAVGGAGLVMTEATAVSPEGRISPEDLGIWSDAHTEALAPVAALVRDQGSVPGIQLAHAGRKASKRRPWDGSTPIHGERGWTPVGPTDEPYPGDDPLPTAALDREGVERIVEEFRAAADRARDAGFEVAEVHAAHGYLLHEFLSPVTNTRDDGYGGDFAGRTRLVREVCEAVREVWGDRALFLRVSATDWLPDRDAWTVDDSARLASALAEVVDLVDVSAGGIHPDQHLPQTGPHYQVRYAERVGETGVPVGAVGGITTPEGADAVIQNDRADLAIIGREHLRDPYFTLHAASALGREDRVEIPPQYRRGF